jgi:hypothetical protein
MFSFSLLFTFHIKEKTTAIVTSSDLYEGKVSFTDVYLFDK